jgi:hypothetical protein
MGIASERSMSMAGLAGASSTTSCATASMRGDDDDIPRVSAKGKRGRGRGRGRGEKGERWGVERQRVWPCVGRGQRAFHTPLWSRLWSPRAASWGLSHCSGRSRGVRDDEPSVEHLEADGLAAREKQSPKRLLSVCCTLDRRARCWVGVCGDIFFGRESGGQSVVVQKLGIGPLVTSRIRNNGRRKGTDDGPRAGSRGE